MGQPVGVRLSPSAPISFRVLSSMQATSLGEIFSHPSFLTILTTILIVIANIMIGVSMLPKDSRQKRYKLPSHCLWGGSGFFGRISSRHTSVTGQFPVQLPGHGLFSNRRSSQPQMECDRTCHYLFRRAGPVGWGRCIQYFIEQNNSLPNLWRM